MNDRAGVRKLVGALCANVARVAAGMLFLLILGIPYAIVSGAIVIRMKLAAKKSRRDASEDASFRGSVPRNMACPRNHRGPQPVTESGEQPIDCRWIHRKAKPFIECAECEASLHGNSRQATL